LSRPYAQWVFSSANYFPIWSSVLPNLCLILTFMRFVFQVPIHGNVLILAFTFSALSFRLAFYRHPGLQQSHYAVRGHPARLPHFFLGRASSFRDTSFREKPCPRSSTSSAMFHSAQLLLHQHHPWHHPARRRPFPISGSMASLSMLSAPSFFSFAARRFPEKSHHGLKHFAGSFVCSCSSCEGFQVFSLSLVCVSYPDCHRNPHSLYTI